MTVAVINHFVISRYLPQFVTGTGDCPQLTQLLENKEIDLDSIFLAPLREEPLYRGGLSSSLFLLLRMCVKDRKDEKARITRKDTSIVLVSLIIIWFGLFIFSYVFKTSMAETAMAAAITAGVLGIRFMPRSKVRFAVLAALMVVQSFLFARLHLSLYCEKVPDFWNETLLTLPQFLGGLYLSLVAWRVGLRGSLLAHGLNNLLFWALKFI